MPYFKNDNILLIHIPNTGACCIENYFYKSYNKSINTLYSKFNFKLNNHKLQYNTYRELYDYANYFDIDSPHTKNKIYDLTLYILYSVLYQI